MKHISIVVCALLAAGALMPVQAAAQGQPNMYGPTITADQAKTVAAAAVAEAKKNQWTMAVAIVDTAGDLVYFEKMDNTQVGSVDVAIAKARSSARFKRPTKAFQDALAAGGEGWRILSLDGAVAVEGGLPLVVGGKIIGVHRTLGYFDGVNLARRAGTPALFSAALMDATCPPSTVYGAFNGYAGPRRMLLWEYNGHEGGGILDEVGALDFLREHLTP